MELLGVPPFSKITLRNSIKGFAKPDDGSYEEPCLTPYIQGAAVMIKRKVIERVGELPECYFLYYEELDWSIRLSEAGYTMWYYPVGEVLHKESQSTGVTSGLKVYFMTRNRLIFASRNRKGVTKFLSFAFQMLLAFPKTYIMFLARGKNDYAVAAWRGVRDFVLKKKSY